MGMVLSAGVGLEGRPRRRHPLTEKRRIVELTFEPGASVAQVAQAHGVNANQLFKWRRAFERGELLDPAAVSTALLPVAVTAPCEAVKPEPTAQERRYGSLPALPICGEAWDMKLIQRLFNMDTP